MINDEPIKIEKAAIQIDGPILNITDCDIAIPGIEGQLNGKIRDIWSYLLPEKKDRSESFNIEAVLIASMFDFERFLPWVQHEKEDKKNDKSEVSRNWLRDITGSLNAQIKDFRYKKILADDFDGTFHFGKDRVVLSGDVSAMEGELNIEGELKMGKRTALTTTIIGEDVNINKCFDQCENFGQDFIQDKHISGRLNANVLIEARWDEEGRFLNDDLHVLSNMVINDGELIGFKMLYDFADYIKIMDLRHIKFANMQNWMEVKNGRIIMPRHVYSKQRREYIDKWCPYI